MESGRSKVGFGGQAMTSSGTRSQIGGLCVAATRL